MAFVALSQLHLFVLAVAGISGYIWTLLTPIVVSVFLFSGKLHLVWPNDANSVLIYRVYSALRRSHFSVCFRSGWSLSLLGAVSSSTLAELLLHRFYPASGRSTPSLSPCVLLGPVDALPQYCLPDVVFFDAAALD